MTSRLRGAGSYLGDDRIAYTELDVANRLIDIEVPQSELDARRPHFSTTNGYAKGKRGWERLYVDQVMGVNTFADVDFLKMASGEMVWHESH